MIVEERQVDAVPFAELKPGAVFRADGSVWLAVHPYLPRVDGAQPVRPAINAATGQWTFFSDTQPVQHLPQARLVVTP